MTPHIPHSTHHNPTNHPSPHTSALHLSYLARCGHGTQRPGLVAPLPRPGISQSIPHAHTPTNCTSLHTQSTLFIPHTARAWDAATRACCPTPVLEYAAPLPGRCRQQQCHRAVGGRHIEGMGREIGQVSKGDGERGEGRGWGATTKKCVDSNDVIGLWG